jgi:molybdate transport system substrate-binding protein
MIRAAITGIAALLTVALTSVTSSAAEIKLLAAAALEQVLSELLPQFEKETGHTVSVTYGPVGALTDRLRRGEAADVAIVTDNQIDELQFLGKVAAGNRIDIARTGVGAFVRKGSPKPDLSSVDAFKRTLEAAKAVTYADPASGGAGGIYVAQLIERLGLSAAMNRKIKLDLSGGYRLYQMVAGGDADLGFDQMSIIFTKPAVEFVGPLPAAIQKYTTFAAGVGAGSEQAATAGDLVKFLSSPAAKARMKAGGLLLGNS